MPTYLNEADVFVLVSPKESFGLAALEALSVGLPVICCDFEESRFVLKNAAYLINCTDEKLVLKTITMAVDSNENRELKEERKFFVYTYYSWQTLAKQYSMMFNTILNS